MAWSELDASVLDSREGWGLFLPGSTQLGIPPVGERRWVIQQKTPQMYYNRDSKASSREERDYLRIRTN